MPGLVKMPSIGHSTCSTVSNPLPAFSCFLKGSVTFFTPYPSFCRFSWIICGGMADGATTKDHCCDSFTPPHTWETDKYQFIGSLSFPTRSSFSSTVMQQNSMPPTNQPHQLCFRLIPGGWTLVLVPTLEVSTELWLLGRGSQRSLGTAGMGAWCQCLPLRPGTAMPSTILKLLAFPISSSKMPWLSLNRVFIYSARHSRSRSSIFPGKSTTMEQQAGTAILQ